MLHAYINPAPYLHQIYSVFAQSWLHAFKVPLYICIKFTPCLHEACFMSTKILLHICLCTKFAPSLRQSRAKLVYLEFRSIRHYRALVFDAVAEVSACREFFSNDRGRAVKQ